MSSRFSMYRLLGLIIGGMLIVGLACVSTKYVYLDPTMQKYPPVAPDSVRVFVEESELDTLQYVRIAYIEASGSGSYTSQAGMIEAMRKRAGELGGNGVLLPKINEPGAGAKVAAAIFGTDTQRKGNALAIRILGTAKPSE